MAGSSDSKRGPTRKRLKSVTHRSVSALPIYDEAKGTDGTGEERVSSTLWRFQNRPVLKTIEEDIKMVQSYSRLTCADNTGARKLMCISVLGGTLSLIHI